MTKKLALAAMAAALLSTTVLAQSSPPAPAAKDPVAAQSTAQGKWRASKLIGLNVYNAQNEKLGDISEILIDKSGKVEGIIIGVGGFLGMGQRDIKVEMSKLKFVDEPPKTASTTSNSTTGAGASRPATTTTTSSTAKRWYPDHAVLSGASKDQLKAMPEFKYTR